ncbi:hypothetical protein VTK26DRAFT_5496 [Humicola hyalothermophila]
MMVVVVGFVVVVELSEVVVLDAGLGEGGGDFWDFWRWDAGRRGEGLGEGGGGGGEGGGGGDRGGGVGGAGAGAEVEVGVGVVVGVGVARRGGMGMRGERLGASLCLDRTEIAVGSHPPAQVPTAPAPSPAAREMPPATARAQAGQAAGTAAADSSGGDVREGSNPIGQRPGRRRATAAAPTMPVVLLPAVVAGGDVGEGRAEAWGRLGLRVGRGASSKELGGVQTGGGVWDGNRWLGCRSVRSAAGGRRFARGGRARR